MKIKEGLEEKYKKFTTLTEDPDYDPNEKEGNEYAQAIVDAAERVGVALDEGKTPEEAIEALKGGDLTGYMAGVATQLVVQFNPRGEELKPAWNKHCGGTGEEKGTINPALITIKD
jgi:hypothetical protein